MTIILSNSEERTVLPGARYMPQLDALRAIAVLSVVIHHSPIAKFVPLPLGGMGVRLFFVLSGFLITGILIKCRSDQQNDRNGAPWFSLRQFYMRRFLRIFPLYYFVVACAAIANYGTARQLMPWLATYTLNIQLALSGEWNEFSHFWSLAVEEHFYLVWPWIVLFLPRRWLGPAAVLLIIIGPAYRYWAFVSGLNTMATRCFTLACLDTLGIGSLLAIACYSELPQRFIRKTLGYVLLPAGLAELGVIRIFHSELLDNTASELALGLCYAWLIYEAARGIPGRLGKILGARPLVYIGKISYGIYIYHVFMPAVAVFALGKFGFNPRHDFGLIAILTVGLDLVVPVLSWQLIEQPINELKRFFPYRHRTTPREIVPARVRVAPLLLVGIPGGLVAFNGLAYLKGERNRNEYDLMIHREVAATDAVDYYVSSTGDDRLNGTSTSTAWRTVSKVNEMSFRPGDRIQFEGGQTFIGQLTFDANDSGTPHAPVTISSYGEGRATIDALEGNGIVCENSFGIQVTKLNLQASGPEKNRGSGIVFTNDLHGDLKLPYIRIEDVGICGFGESGILIDGKRGKSGFEDVLIADVDVRDNAVAGIQILGEFSRYSRQFAHRNIHIKFATVRENAGIPGANYDISGAGIVLSDVADGAVERCLAFNNGARCEADGSSPAGIVIWDCREIVVQHNESHDNRCTGVGGGGGIHLNGGVSNSLVRFNYSHHNGGAGFFLGQFEGARSFTNVQLHHNISASDGRNNGHGGIRVWGDVVNSDICNNTIYCESTSNGEASPIQFIDDRMVSRGISVHNNIFYSRNDVSLIDVAAERHQIRFQGNNYFSAAVGFRISWGGNVFRSIEAWRRATGQERWGASDSGWSVDPQLQLPGNVGSLNDVARLESLKAFRLRAGSPMVDAGIHVLQSFGDNYMQQDFFGNPVPQGLAIDIGAHESASQPSDMPLTEND